MAYMEYSEKDQDKLSKMIPLKDLYNCPCERSLREWEGYFNHIFKYQERYHMRSEKAAVQHIHSSQIREDKF